MAEHEDKAAEAVAAERERLTEQVVLARNGGRTDLGDNRDDDATRAVVAYHPRRVLTGPASAAYVRSSRHAQQLPETTEDPAVLERVASTALFTRLRLSRVVDDLVAPLTLPACGS